MTTMSPAIGYTDKADEAAAFYASKGEPGKHIGRFNVRARIDHRDRNPPNRWIVVCHAMAVSCSHDCRDIRPETEGCRVQPNDLRISCGPSMLRPHKRLFRWSPSAASARAERRERP